MNNYALGGCQILDSSSEEWKGDLYKGRFFSLCAKKGFSANANTAGCEKVNTSDEQLYCLKGSCISLS